MNNRLAVNNSFFYKKYRYKYKVRQDSVMGKVSYLL
jgi:hypothetical protein